MRSLDIVDENFITVPCSFSRRGLAAFCIGPVILSTEQAGNLSCHLGMALEGQYPPRFRHCNLIALCERYKGWCHGFDVSYVIFLDSLHNMK